MAVQMKPKLTALEIRLLHALQIYTREASVETALDRINKDRNKRIRERNRKPKHD